MKQQVRTGMSRWLGGVMIPARAVAMLPVGTAHAVTPTPVPIIGYDILDAPAAGTGGWSHTYDGTYTLTRTDLFQGGTVGNYSGGSGTLNDEIISSSILGDASVVHRGTGCTGDHLAAARADNDRINRDLRREHRR